MTNAREYPSRPITGVGVVVRKENSILLVQRGNPPSRGDWGLPGGALELGETLRDAAVREVREECGIEIALGGVVDVIDIIVRDGDDRVQYHYAIIDFVADYMTGVMRASTDVLDARWVSLAELSKFTLTKKTREVIRKAIEPT